MSKPELFFTEKINMQTIEIVTQDGCSYCEAAKDLLRTRKLDYEEVHVIHQADKALELLLLARRRTMPQIFIDGKSIGGFAELVQMVKPRH